MSQGRPGGPRAVPPRRDPRGAANTGKGVRAFLALEIPDPLREEIAGHQSRLRQQLPRARWVRATSLHLTLKFLGDVLPNRLQDLVAELGPRLATLAPVQVGMAGSGFFPTQKRPRVAWIGGQAIAIEPVIEAIEAVAARFAFARERRPWALHLTLARLKGPWPAAATEEYLAWGKGLRLEPFDCSEVVLFSSSLQPDGAVYNALARMPLRASS